MATAVEVHPDLFGGETPIVRPHAQRAIEVMLCVNDYRSGRSTGRVDSIDIGDAELLRLYAVDGVGPKCEIVGRNLIKIARCDYEARRVAWREFPVIAHRTWVGNWCWDLAIMRLGTVVDLLDWLQTEEWDIDAGEASLYERWSRHQPITLADLVAAIGAEESWAS